LALLVPAEPPVRNGLRAQILEAAKYSILFGYLEGLAKHLDFNQALKVAKHFVMAIRAMLVVVRFVFCRHLETILRVAKTKATVRARAQQRPRGAVTPNKQRRNPAMASESNALATARP
jgi:hypothetical protein